MLRRLSQGRLIPGATLFRLGVTDGGRDIIGGSPEWAKGNRTHRPDLAGQSLGWKREARMLTNLKSNSGACLIAGVAIALMAAASPAAAGDCGATCFMGGLMAGRVLTQRQQQQREQTQAMQEAARGGGGYGAGYGGGYGAPHPAPAAPPPSAPKPSPEQQLQQLDKLAAGGYITPQEYKERRQAILNGM